MGRAGLEPATLGLKVQPRRLQRTAADRICLQVTAFGTATNCRRPAETGRYAHRTLSWASASMSGERTLAQARESDRQRPVAERGPWLCWREAAKRYRLMLKKYRPWC